MTRADYIEFIANYDNSPCTSIESIKKTFSKFNKEELCDHYKIRIKHLSEEQIRFYHTMRTELYRPPVDIGNSILMPIIGVDRSVPRKDIPQEQYNENIRKFERKVEESLITTCSRLGIHAMVKTDPYSLPYTHEIAISLRGESYLNGAYEIFRVARPFIKELLNKGADKIRFYAFINVLTPDKPSLLNTFGRVDYRIRYYWKD
jgi:hypothetical protein